MRTVIEEYALVLASAVGLGLSALPVADMAADAWDREELAHHLVYVLTEGVLGLDIDVAVVVPVAVLAGVLLLFFLDRRKRFQAIFVALFVALFVWRVRAGGYWGSEVAWGRYTVLFGACLLGGIAIGLYGSDWNGIFGSEFPTASWLLYVAVGIGATVSFVEYHLTYTSPIQFQRVTGEVMIGSTGQIGITTTNFGRHLLATGVLLIVLRQFVTYSNQSEVLVIAPDDIAEADFFGTFYNELRATRDARPIAGSADINGHVTERRQGNTGQRSTERYLNVATGMLDRENLTDAVQYRPGGRIRFKYESNGPLGRQTEISATGERADDITPDVQHELRQLVQGRAELLFRTVKGLFGGILPGDTDRDLVDRIDGADTVVLVAPLSEAIDYSLEEMESIDAEGNVGRYCTRPNFGPPYESLEDTYVGNAELPLVDSPNVIVVATDAGRGQKLYERCMGNEVSLYSEEFRTTVQSSMLDFDLHAPGVVYPVVSTGEDDRGDGVDKVVERL